MRILGVHIDNITMSGALDKIEAFLINKGQHYVVTPNPEMVVLAQKDEEFKKILNQAHLAIPDGVGLIWASRFLKEPLQERVSGIDLIEQLINRLAEKDYSFFFLGGENGAPKRTIKRLKINYPRLKVAGYEQNIEKSLLIINQTKPDILFIALGAPKQEKWIVNNLSKIPSVKVAIGVGGAFDFISGRVKRAPEIIRRTGLEWLWRFIQQPWRIRRIYNAIIKFPLEVFIGHLSDIFMADKNGR